MNIYKMDRIKNKLTTRLDLFGDNSKEIELDMCSLVSSPSAGHLSCVVGSSINSVLSFSSCDVSVPVDCCIIFVTIYFLKVFLVIFFNLF